MPRLCLITFFVMGLLSDPAICQTMTMQFTVSRDVGIDAWENHAGYGGVFEPGLPTEEWNNAGRSGQVRGKKFDQHTAIFDWDTDEINRWISDNTNPADILSWTLSIYPVLAPPDDVRLISIESLNDWAEGDGVQVGFENFNWTRDTSAATQNFAQTYWKFDTDGVTKILDEDRSLPWIDDSTGTGGINDAQYSVLKRGDSFSQGDLIPNHINSVEFSALDLSSAAFDRTFASVQLDDKLMDEILHNENNRGLLFGPLDEKGSNWTFFDRESVGVADRLADSSPGPVAPFLEVTVTPAPIPLQAGDADQDFDFDQLDLVQVSIAAKYLTGASTTWGEGDWNGAPGGSQGDPPAGNGLFDQLDIVASLGANKYLTGPYGAPEVPVPMPPDVPKQLQAGDADQDLDFDQLDIVKVSISAKYLSGAAATWGDGDWDGAPGGTQGNPPAGNGFFDQLDIVSSLAAGKYLTGPYAALAPGGGTFGDEQTSLVYHADTGELTVDSPASNDLTSINITSDGGKFIGVKPPVLDGAFDNFAADNVFKATFGGSFGDITFGSILPTGLSAAEVVADLTVVGSLAGGGDLGAVDLVWIPEPSSVLLCLLGLVGITCFGRLRCVSVATLRD